MYIGGGNIYKSIEEYDASNWNYLLLVNVLNQVKHSDQPIDAELIKDTATLIEKQDKYNKYTTQLNNAVHDITEYFNELELYGYLEKTRAIKWDDSKFEKGKQSTEQVKTTKADSIRRMQDLFKNIEIYVKSGKKKDNNADEDKVDISEVVKGTNQSTRLYDIDLRNYFIGTQIENGRLYDEHNVVYSRAYLDPDSDYGKVFYGHPFFGNDLHIMIKIRTCLLSESIPEMLLTKAQETGLTTDEKTYLDMWNIKMFLLACGFNAGNIMYDREHMFWESMREMLSDLENQLLPTGTVIPADKTLSDLYRDKIGKILKKIKE